MSWVTLCFWAFTLWLGAYLLVRRSASPAVTLTGAGLLAYALAVAAEGSLGALLPAALSLSPVFWMGAALNLLPLDHPMRARLLRLWAALFIPLLLLARFLPWGGAAVVIGLAGCLLLVGRLALASRRSLPLALAAVGALFIPLSAGLLLLPQPWVPRDWAVALLGLDMIALGLAITAWDAFEEGEALRAPLLRSFLSATLSAATLAIVAVMFGAGRGLTYSLVAVGVLSQILAEPLQILLDRLTLPAPVNHQREELLAVADSLSRRANLSPVDLGDEEFARLTRRALSHLGDLPRLAASPLTNLPALDGNNPLERAQALKSLLKGSIQKLKPVADSDFGVADEWRYYNALYFPYVLGLRPYARRSDGEPLDKTSQAALRWFQTSVPERTLHNWQNAAARLVAQDIKSSLGR